MKHKKEKILKGKIGEEIALNYLKRKKYKLLERNLRYRYGEIDLIMEKKGVIVFVEVRSKKTESPVSPIESVNFYKKNRIINSAKFFLERENLTWKKDCRFDIISIIYNKNNPENYKIEHFEDVFRE